MRTALSIAGSDSSGGAGIQADIKTMLANGVFAMTAITALTAQNTTGVRDILEATPAFLGEQIDALDFDDPHYTRKAQDLQERQNRVYDQIASIEVSIAEVQTRMDNIRQRRISTDNVYQFLLYFDKLYDQFTDLEKKTFMNSFIERVEIYPERRSDGRIVKRIEFRFPVYFNGSKITGLGWDETDMSETVMVLSKLSNIEQTGLR